MIEHASLQHCWSLISFHCWTLHYIVHSLRVQKLWKIKTTIFQVSIIPTIDLFINGVYYFTLWSELFTIMFFLIARLQYSFMPKISLSAFSCDLFDVFQCSFQSCITTMFINHSMDLQHSWLITWHGVVRMLNHF